MPLMSSVGRFVNAANQKADQLTAGLKVALCLPSIIAGLPQLGKGLIGSTISNIGVILENVTSTVLNTVTNTINGSVNTITGSIAGVVDSAQRAIDNVVGSINKLREFRSGISRRAKDIGEFTADKENCNFAAATMLNCITAQAVASVSDREAVNIAKGLKPVSDFANEVADKISAPGGAIDRTVQKQSAQVDRATKVVQKQDIF